MGALSEVAAVVRGTLNEWLQLRWGDLRAAELAAAFLLGVALLAIPLILLLARRRGSRHAPRQIALPAVLPVMQRSGRSALRHSAFVLFVLGIPFFAVAFADPRVTAVREETSQSGRRMAILIDASGSMVLPFEAPRLKPTMDRAFYTAVAAAERFVRLRMAANHNDVIGVIEFGNEAFVVTPFTTDYENVVLSLRLIGDPRAWNRFNVFGTTIIQGLDQGLQLFRTFEVLDASGNMMVIITDGNDGETTFRGRTLDGMMAEARDRKIPIYMVRVGFGKRLGDVPWDSLWKPAVERSGGRFYPAFDEDSMLRALDDIDRRSTGRIAVRQYSAVSPAFPGFAMAAVALWLTAGALKLTFPYFRTFP
jgi:Ca-activated chloride channel family protein